jgi:hypothetical protein
LKVNASIKNISPAKVSDSTTVASITVKYNVPIPSGMTSYVFADSMTRTQTFSMPILMNKGSLL